MAQTVGAGIAAAILALGQVDPLPAQVGTSDLIREGVAACALAWLVSATRHEAPRSNPPIAEPTS